MYRYLLLVSRIHSVAITSKSISDGQSRSGYFIKAGCHCMQSFSIYLRRTLLFFTVSLMIYMVFKYFYTRLHNDFHIREGTRYEEKLTFVNVSFN